MTESTSCMDICISTSAVKQVDYSHIRLLFCKDSAGYPKQFMEISTSSAQYLASQQVKICP